MPRLQTSRAKWEEERTEGRYVWTLHPLQGNRERGGESGWGYVRIRIVSARSTNKYRTPIHVGRSVLGKLDVGGRTTNKRK